MRTHKLLVILLALPSLLAAEPPSRPASARSTSPDGCPAVFVAVSAEDAAEWNELATVGKLIERLAPPETSIVVMPGQSPAPLLAYAQNRYDDYAYGVPFTLGAFKDQPPALTSEEQAALSDVFRAHMPRLAPNVKQVGVADYSSSSSTILVFTDWLRAFYQREYGQRPNFLVIPLVQQGNLPLFDEKNAASYRLPSKPIILDGFSRLWHHLQHENFKYASPHGQHYVYAARDPRRYLVPYSVSYRPEYLRLRQQIWQGTRGR